MLERQLHKSFMSDEIVLPEHLDRHLGSMLQFREFMMRYNSALREIRTKFEVLNDHLSVAYNRNPIEMIKSRVKTPASIMEKLQRRNLEISYSSIEENIHDVAGIRIICSFVNDIYEVAKMLASQDDVRLIAVKDYIKNPKENGYRSYHMIVEIPVFFANNKMDIKVEVQLRTIAMDFWASLEHKIRYKKNLKDSENIAKRLKECAELITDADEKMQEINEMISSDANDSNI